ncbi:hypothetical protein CAPTEDRAFT_138866 [Capitella teleta]|uniref:Amyloid protein-binding protein 2 n=1 Tax=Capitella teleta TaxID=283909 RepID=R7V7S8_CAPTE|nr:hypothetical protein CAPTEDRAFT_138866 [Capitella teleta]|eukprot:ELU14913.1 hypothetical protein CAPTEDRAFT_138866 [Capitella teleta]
MASACDLDWVPDSLYNTAVSVVVSHFRAFKSELRLFPDNVQFDIYYQLYNKGMLVELGQEFSCLEIFARVLKVHDKRNLLHHCFQALMKHRVSFHLATAYSQHCCTVHASSCTKRIQQAIQLGFNLGGFLSDAGWFPDAEVVLKACLQLCKQASSTQALLHALECCVRLLHVRNANCQYGDAEKSWVEAQEYVQELTNQGHKVNRATLLSEYCALLFAKSQYDMAYRACCTALNEINPSLPPRVIVDVFRQCAKACVVKREFQRAELLIKFAVQCARDHFGGRHHIYADALLDYGFYLLNVDAVCQAVQVYQAALDIRTAVFGQNNLHVAIAHEDLAYSSYVFEYSSGEFQHALEHAERAIEIITCILPEDHLLLASSKRVKALILEEIAIDSPDEASKRLLSEAQDLHLTSLSLAQKAFGENNVQTAKHYGNLGRLYQSMGKFELAETMHLKAIAVKEKLLGPDDYEVALSIGHLASLYNYDMEKYGDAEKLYLRSIAIGRKLFGPGYSGLEYDYRGLLRLYSAVGNSDKNLEYYQVLNDWYDIRDRNKDKDKKPLEFDHSDNCQSILGVFFKLPS